MMKMKLTRKGFLGAAAGGGLLLLLQACGGGGDDGPANSAGAPGTPDGGQMPPIQSCGADGASIANNHGHSLTVPLADLDSTVDKTYSIQGAANHDHQITLTVAQLQALKAGNEVTVTSTTDFSHSHGVTTGCSDMPPIQSCGADGAAISGNHGHSLTVPVADLDSTVDKTYSIQGASNHDHQITLTAAQLQALKAGKDVTVTSTTDFSHSHGVTTGCSSQMPPIESCGADGASISGNHGHSLTVPVADLDSTVDKTYSIQGASNHDHKIALTVAQLQALKAGNEVTVTSTTDFSHSHGVTTGCI